MRLHLLGPRSITTDAGTQLPLTQPRVTALLAYLVLESPRMHSRSLIASMLWPDSDPDRSRQCLRQTLCETRRLLRNDAPDALRSDRDWVGCGEASSWSVDVAEFLALAASDTVEAHLVHRGQFLEGFQWHGSERWVSWCESWRLRVDSARVRSLRLPALDYEAAGEIAAALHCWQHIAELDPWHEEAHRHILLLHTRAGNRVAAVRHHVAFVASLQQEFGIAPELETIRLFAAICGQEKEASGQEDVRA